MRVVALAPLALLLAACTSSCHPGDGARAESPRARTNVSASTMAGTASTRRFVKPPAEELRKTLSPIAWSVTQENGTEPPFQNAFFDHHEAGIYVDVTTGEPLFSSTDKFESGTGWPSFTRPIDEAHVTRHTDATHGMTRVEARSRAGDAHLGHVFDDGPQPTGERWCINSASLRFVPVDRLEAEGYAGFLPLFGRTAKVETAILAGGCFWGMEELLRKIPGVVSTEVGYESGAEAVKVTFRPGELAYATLLEDWYFRMHDPTTKDRQGNDTGAQYRSAIFFTSEAQRVTAEEVKVKVGKAGRWKGPIVTQIAPATAWKVGEEHHQDYLQKNPGGYTCHYLREWL